MAVTKRGARSLQEMWTAESGQPCIPSLKTVSCCHCWSFHRDQLPLAAGDAKLELWKFRLTPVLIRERDYRAKSTIGPT